MSSPEPHLRCVICTHEEPINKTLGACFKAWSQQRWLAYRCSACGSVNHLAIDDGVVTEGELTGFPGPQFEARCAVLVGDLEVLVREGAIDIRRGRSRWTVGVQ